MHFLRLLGAARLSLPRVFPLLRDRAVPLWLKAACVVLALLIVSPLDLFGDIPVLGLFDDAASARAARERLRSAGGEPARPHCSCASSRACTVNPPLGALNS